MQPPPREFVVSDRVQSVLAVPVAITTSVSFVLMLGTEQHEAYSENHIELLSTLSPFFIRLVTEFDPSVLGTNRLFVKPAHISEKRQEAKISSIATSASEDEFTWPEGLSGSERDLSHYLEELNKRP